MNIIDAAIILVLAVSTIIGLYNGFIVSAFNAASFIVAWLAAIIFYPLVSKLILHKFPKILTTIAYYTNISSKIPDVEDKTTKISFFSHDKIAELLSDINLPNPFGKIVAAEAFSTADSIKTLGEFLDSTIAVIILNIVSFLILFALIKLLFVVAIAIAKAVVSLPVLKQFDSLFGAGFGVLRGVFILYFIFALIPILIAIAPVDIINEYLDGSLLAGLFYKTNIFTNFISGKL